MTSIRRLLGIAALLTASASSLGQVAFNEVEPNETKPTATNALLMQPGDFLTGTTTGTLTTAGGTSLDTFRIKMAAVPAGIYKYQLVLTSATPGQIMSIRGVSTTAGVPTTTDVQFQTALNGVVQWYGFGLQEELYIRITGGAATTAPYVATLSRSEVVPTDFAGSVSPGDVTLVADDASANTYDTDWWVYGNGFAAVPNFGHDDTDNVAITRNLVPGTYHIAGGIYNSGNSLGSPVDDTFRVGNVLDFPNAFACTSTSTVTTPMGFNLTSAAGTISASAPRAGAFDVVWFRFVVAPSQNPVGSGSATPSGGLNDGTTTIHLAVNVVAGINPPSTGLAVSIDLSSIGGPSNAVMFDDGLHGDGAANDLVFGLNFTIPAGTAGGTYSLPFGIADAQGRTGTGAINNINVVAPPETIFDFGDFSVPNSGTQVFDLTAGQIAWFKFRLTAAADAATGTFVDLDTENSGCVDTEIGVYRVDGTLVASDDDSGSGLQSQLSFGTGTRPAANTCAGASAAYDGRNGPLAAGTYYVAAGRFNVNFNAIGFNVTSTGADTTGFNLNIRSRVDPIAPTATSTPRTVLLDGAAVPVTLALNVTPGAFPPSTGLSVRVDASQLGGSNNLLMSDDGVAPDAAAGDNIYSAGISVAANTSANTYALPYTITDNEARSASGDLTVIVTVPLFNFGNMTTPPRGVTQSFDIPAGAPAWFKFSLSADADAASGQFLDIDTENSGCADTEIAVFRSDGTLVTTDDNDGSGLQSQLSFGAGGRPVTNSGCAGDSILYNGRDGTLPAGTYYLAVAQFNATFTDGFGATSTGVGLFGVNVNIRSFIDPVAPTATVTATPNSVANDGLGFSDIRVTVAPGVFPPSTGLAVHVDASSVGGGSSLVASDDGVAPDVTAGDNIYTARVSISAAFAAGDYAINVSVTDAQGRNTNASANLTVVDATGACCQASGCTFGLRTDCIAAGGNFLGHNVPCTSGDGFDISSQGAGAFEDISGTGTPLTLTDDSNVNIPVGFSFRFFGVDYTDCYVASNGYVSFGAGYNVYINVPIPAVGVPDNAIYAYWDDLNPGAGGSISYQTLGTSPNQRLIVQWTGVPQFGNTDSNTFQIVMFEGGNVEYRYGTITAPVAGDVTIGAENADGTAADSYDATQLGTGNIGLQLAVRTGSDNCTSGCRIDFNHDGDINADDLGDFITCYFSLPPCQGADFNGADGVNADDLGDFITAYFQGC